MIRLFSGVMGGISTGAFLVFYIVHHSLLLSIRHNKAVKILVLSPLPILIIFPLIFFPQHYWFFIETALEYILITNLITVGITLFKRVQILIPGNKYSIS